MGKNKTAGTGNIRIVALVVLIAVLFTLAILTFNKWEGKRNGFPSVDNTPQGLITHNGKEYRLKDDIETVLVIGLDSFDKAEDDTANTNNKRADFLLLLVFDDKNGTVNALQINRDTMAQINRLDIAGNRINSFNSQIALAHTQGNGKEVSCRNTADAVSSLLMDIKIDRYFSVTMEAVKDYNDLLGGVSVKVLDDFTASDPAMIKGETVRLTGTQALLYVRARQGMEDQTNLHRMLRQRQYLGALYDATKQRIAKDGAFSLKAATAMSKYMVSNCTVYQLQTIMNKITSYTSSDIKELQGESVTGVNSEGEPCMEFYPDEEATKELVISLFYE